MIILSNVLEEKFQHKEFLPASGPRDRPSTDGYPRAARRAGPEDSAHGRKSSPDA